MLTPIEYVSNAKWYLCVALNKPTVNIQNQNVWYVRLEFIMGMQYS